MEKISPTLQRFILLLGLSLINAFSPLQAHHIPLPMLATGYYFDGHFSRPLMIQSLDHGASWKYPSFINEVPLPIDYADAGLNKSACNHSICIATGNYYNSELNPMPLLLQSSNPEQHWYYQDMISIKTPSDFQKGWFNDSFCKNTQCFAVGLYENNNGPQPLLALQKPGSTQWRYVEFVSQNILPENFQEGWFETISCSHEVCVAAGNYLDTQAQRRRPLVIVSHDDGETWTSPFIKENLTNTTDYNDTSLYASSCDNEQCLVVGEYSDPSTPLLMQSTDHGANWNTPTFSLPSDFEAGWFIDVDCKGGFCIAVGSYFNGEQQQPLLLFSPDRGTTWTLKETAPASELGFELQDGQYVTAACNEMGCMAGGSADNSIGMYPLITVSHDKGLSWDYPSSARTSAPAAELGNGFFRTISCQQNNCVASGDYTVDSAYYPLLALSQDNGSTWAFPIAVTDPDILPPDFLNGHF